LSSEEKSGWVTVTEPLFTKDGSKMAVIHPQRQDGEAGDYRHLTLVDLASPTSRPIALTKGKFVVTEILSWDEENHFM
jgi:dipeptidyl-peptidase-4